jgi:tetratricopeptide (TPR) repeat protein
MLTMIVSEVFTDLFEGAVMGKKIHLTGLLILFLLGAVAVTHASQEEIRGIIRLLDEQVASAESDEERAKFCCFRARHYLKLKETDQAEQDYLEALDYNYAGWILNEYGYFLYRSGEYERAFRAADRLKEDFPQFKNSALKLKDMARKKYQEAYYAANPPTIIMDTEVNHDLVTRHDLIRRQGGAQPKLYKTNLKTSSNSRKTASRSSSKKPKQTKKKKARS